MKRFRLTAAALLLLAGTAVCGKTLTVGVASGALSMDPHGFEEVATISILSNIFEAPVTLDGNLSVRPALAVSWENPEPTEWIVRLRRGVRFHNGSVFNADDVLFSFDRIKHWARSGYRGEMAMIVSAEKIDDYTVRFTTRRPFPLFLKKLSRLWILDKETVEKRTDGWIAAHPVGTGPYRFVEWRRGDRIVLEADETYREGKAVFDRVVFKPLTDSATRVAAILSGIVDLIDRVPTMDVKRIRRHREIRFYRRPGLRLIYLQMDQYRRHSPWIVSRDGKNPLLDRRVRRALYYGIDEEAIVRYIMSGYALPAGQLCPEPVFGYDPALKRPGYDPQKAKALLKAAGYPDGFTIRLDAPNNRYVNDAKIAEAVAVSLAKIGIRVEVNAMPKSRFFAQVSRQESSFFLIGWEDIDGDAGSMMSSCIHTYDRRRGYGRYNNGRFSDPRFDRVFEASEEVMDRAERLRLLRKAQRIALVEDQCVIPLHFQVDLYAAKRSIRFRPRLDGQIRAYEIGEEAP